MQFFPCRFTFAVVSVSVFSYFKFQLTRVGSGAEQHSDVDRNGRALDLANSNLKFEQKKENAGMKDNLNTIRNIVQNNFCRQMF